MRAGPRLVLPGAVLAFTLAACSGGSSPPSPLLATGVACTGPEQCQSGLCGRIGAATVCLAGCETSACPGTQQCLAVKGAAGSGSEPLACVPADTVACVSCGADGDCAGAYAASCVGSPSGASFCARDCSAVFCPDGYTCSGLYGGAERCIPVSGACDCDERTAGLTAACTIDTFTGPCAGQRTCAGATGWGACTPPSLVDPPDETFADANCDGIDGVVSRGMFVAPSGADTETCGHVPGEPCSTIGLALGRAVAEGRTSVFVQAGTYPEVVVLHGGVDVVGGYDASWRRASSDSAGHTVAVVGGLDATLGEYVTVVAHDLATPTAVLDLWVQGPNASGSGPSGAGRSSYGLHAKNVADLSLERVRFIGGNGAPGAAGTSGASASATRAPQGGAGGYALAQSVLCDATSHGAGGAPATNVCSGGLSPDAGAGGGGGEMDTSCGWFTCADCAATPGDVGASAAQFAAGAYGYRGSGGNACGPGGAGLEGRVLNGAPGAGGAAAGFLSGDGWYAHGGGAGALGENGGGGGGGGGSGGCDGGIDSYGAGGGGGGAGGCAASSAAGGGGGGGGSIGLFALSSTVTVRSCTFERGQGASGGAGGAGGAGQSGGLAGPGGAAAGGSLPGGNGGAGGHGGHGGGGGGGAGGISVGVFQYLSTVDVSGSTVSGGSPGPAGQGGPSAPSAPSGERDGYAGEAGAPGALGDVVVCSSAGGC